MKEMLTIRPVTKSDSKAIADIYRPYVEETVVSFETVAPTADVMSARIEEISNHYPYLVAEIDGEVAGYSYSHAWKERAAYAGTLESTVYINHKFKRQGIGRKLMERLIDECRFMGFDSLIACITADNEASCLLHEALGFTKVSHFKGVGRKFGRILDVVDYQLELKPEVGKGTEIQK